MENQVSIAVTCGSCGIEQEPIRITQWQLLRWRQGEHIQNVMPELNASQRELLISGTCDPCFDRMFGEEA